VNPQDHFWFLFTAYGSIWLLLALYLVRLGRHHRALGRELDDLKSRLGGPPPPRA